LEALNAGDMCVLYFTFSSSLSGIYDTYLNAVMGFKYAKEDKRVKHYSWLIINS
jgi:hypothetical protein